MTQFKGFDLSERKYDTRNFSCQGCSNVCRISEVVFPDERPFYHGARCDRFDNHQLGEGTLPDLFSARRAIVFDRDDTGEATDGMLRFSPHGAPRGVIGIPRALLMWDLTPFFCEFFRSLGYEVMISPETNREIVRTSLSGAPPTACLPAKVMHGHVASLLDAEIDILFIPALIDAANANTNTQTNYHCPLVQAQPYILQAEFDFDARGVKTITTPIHFYRQELADKEIASIARDLGAGKKELARAREAGEEAETDMRQRINALGDEALELVAGGATGIVIMSRLYNSTDRLLSLDVPEKLRSLGVLAIPIDALRWEEIDVDPLYPFMQWHAGKRILAAAEIVRKTDRLWGLYLSHFNCGPDSFIVHYVREALKHKPFLTIELDEHSADAGAITRLEAYLDSIGALTEHPRPQQQRPLTGIKRGLDRTKTIYIPYMCDHNYAVAGSLRHFGYNTEVLPPPDEESLTLGRKHSSGGECLPFILTTGDFLKLIARPGFDIDRSCIFMATSTGPCRFCHYFTTQKIILKRLGVNIDFITIESYDAYTISDLGTPFRRAAWYGMAAIDMLQKLLWQTRPYEMTKGESDTVYQESLRQVEAALGEGGIKEMLQVLPSIGERFTQIERTEDRRPLIGIVGEIYVRVNSFSNSNLVELIEELGGEARVASLGEWMSYTFYKKVGDSRIRRDWPAHIKARIERAVLARDGHRLSRTLRGFLPDRELDEPTTEEIIAHSAPYISEAYRGEPVLTMGKAIEYANHGFDGIINALPFSCMPGTMVSAVSNRVKHDFDIPWLNLTFDGQEQTNLRTRLEAFLHQTEFHRRSKNGRAVR